MTTTSVFKFRSIRFAVSTFALFFIASASSATTYNYVGQTFTSVTPPYTTSEKVTGSFTVAVPLPHFMPMTSITSSIISFSFTDGVQTRTQANSFQCDFQVATDGTGNIARWSVYLTQAPHPAIGDPEQTMTLGSAFDLVGTGAAVANTCASISQPVFASSGGPGAWNASLPPGTPTTYHYLGQTFTSLTAPYTTSERVSGSLQLGNPLPPFLPLTDITAAITDFSFTDGIQTRTPSNSTVCGFQVATDAVGNITRWFVYLTQAPHPAIGDPQQTMTLGGGFDGVGTGAAVADPCGSFSQSVFAFSSGPGTWSASLPPGTPTTYHYLGQTFTSLTAPYTTSERVSGSLKLGNPLPPFLPLTDISAAIADFSFTDGIQTRTPSNSTVCGFQVATDAVGNITRWFVYLTQAPHPAIGDPEQTMTLGGGFDGVGTGAAVANPCGSFSQSVFAFSSGPGTWTGFSLPGTPVTYGYVGQHFTTVISPYTTSDRVTGSVQFGNPLPPNLPLTDVTAAILFFSYSDGIQTRTLADSVICNFELSTDSLGRVVEWKILLRQKVASGSDPFSAIDSLHFGIASLDQGGTNSAGGNPCGVFSVDPFGSTRGNSGTWSESGGPAAQGAAIPTLSPLLLAFLAAAIGFAGFSLLRRNGI